MSDDVKETCPDCIDCNAPLSLIDGGEWPTCGPICYGCLADRFEWLNAENVVLKAQVERLTPKPMTLQAAIDVLNRREHLGHKTWRLYRADGKSMAMIGDGSWWLTEFEAIVIAQGLGRDAEGGG